MALRRLKPTGYLPRNTWGADSDYVYGFLNTNLFRWPKASVEGSPDESTIHVFAEQIQVVFAGYTYGLADGEVFVLTRDTQSPPVYTLHYSSDAGATWDVSLVLLQGAYILDRGLCVGYPGEQKTYAIMEYNGANGVDQRIWTNSGDPADPGDWVEKAHWAITDPPIDSIRHGHVIVWDPWEEVFVVSVGDNNVHAGTFAWDGVTPIPDKPVSQLVADEDVIGGVYGDQRARNVDVLVTENWYYWTTDTQRDAQVSTSADIGVFRCSKDFQTLERVDPGFGRSPSGLITGWHGIVVDGQVMLCDDPSGNDTDGGRYMGIYAADDAASGPGMWREVVRVYSRLGDAGRPQGFWHDGDGLCGIAFTRGAGKVAQGETAIFRLGGPWVDRLRGPDYTVVGFEGVKDTLPDSLHPVSWVDPVNGNDSNTGFTPGDAVKTLEALLTGSPARITWGACIMLPAMTEQLSAGITPNWTDYPTNPPGAGSRTGYEGEPNPVQIRGEGPSDTVIVAHPSNGPAGITLANPEQVLMLDGVRVYAEASDPRAVIRVAADGARVAPYQSWLGDPGYTAYSLDYAESVTQSPIIVASQLWGGVSVEGQRVSYYIGRHPSQVDVDFTNTTDNRRIPNNGEACGALAGETVPEATWGPVAVEGDQVTRIGILANRATAVGALPALARLAVYVADLTIDTPVPTYRGSPTTLLGTAVVPVNAANTDPLTEFEVVLDEPIPLTPGQRHTIVISQIAGDPRVGVGRWTNDPDAPADAISPRDNTVADGEFNDPFVRTGTTGHLWMMWGLVENAAEPPGPTPPLGGIHTSAGCTLELGGTGAIESEDNWAEVGEIADLGEFGRVYEEVTFANLANRNTRKFKGTRNDGNLVLQLGRDLLDSGQAALQTALDTDFDYNVRVTLNDAPVGGSPTRFTMKAKVMSFTTNVGGPNSIVGGQVTLGIQTGTISVIAAAES